MGVFGGYRRQFRIGNALLAGDQVLRIDGRPISRGEDLHHVVRTNSGRRLVFLVERDGSEIELCIIPTTEYRA